MFRGSCLCGSVRYETPGPVSHETSCHCTLCRRASGAPFVAWITVPAESFRFTSGQPAFFDSSSHGRRGFCPDCGTPLTFRSSDSPDEVDVTTCSLDDPEGFPPRDHTQVASKLSWVSLADGLPVHAGARVPDARDEGVAVDARPAMWVGHVVLAVTDLAASKDFFLSLGLRDAAPEAPVGVLELRGGTHLLLLPSPTPPPAGAQASFDLMVEDLDDCRVRLVALGLAPSEIQENESHRFLTVREPAGHLVTVNSSHVTGLPV